MFEEKETLERSVAARLRYQMQRTKTSIPKLAKAAGCSKDVIQEYSKGKVLEKHMNITWLKRMAEYFGLDPYYFCTEYHVFIDTKDVPILLKRLREKEGGSQREFAKKKEISLNIYKSYESGRARISESFWRQIKKELEEVMEP
ncbi:MAG: transcriptional regulator [Lachnospiraceae bacterium]|nr:transcriptional regulator [Lachnospiraceae bacterium]